MSDQYGQGSAGQPPYDQPAAGQPPYGQPAQPQYASQEQPPYPQQAQQPYAPTPVVQPQYAQGQYAQNPYGAAYVQQTTVIVGPPRTNTLSIVAFISVWFVSLLGLILGHVALSQIKRSGEGGHGLALAAVIIGYVALGLTVLIVVGYIVFVLVLLGTVASVGSATYTS